MTINIRLKRAAELTFMILLVIVAPVQAQQSCNPNMTETAPASRFTVNADQTVTDKATGLIWKQCVQGFSGDGCATGSAGRFDWEEALAEAQAEIFAGQSDWRLPNIKELSSIVERACSSPALNLSTFPNESANRSNVWSASPRSNDRDSVFNVLFSNGTIGNADRDRNAVVRLVRGGK